VRSSPGKHHLLFCLLLCAALALPSRAADPLVINTRPGWPMAHEGEGVVERLLSEMGARTGIDIELQFLPEERALINASQGLDDGDGPRIREMDSLYPGLVRVDEPLLHYEFSVFTTDPSLQSTAWADLLPYDLAVIRGWKILEKNLAQARSLERVRTPTLLLGMLAADRVDAVVIDRGTGLAEVERLGLEGIHVLEPPLAVRDMYLFLHQHHASLCEPLAQALRAMKADGAYDRIFDEALGPGDAMRAPGGADDG
jgi:polar amino acid transport system substrate-binding protein